MINLIWAMTKDNLIGKGNDLPWHYKEDLQYFKKNTMNKDVLMGYNTYLSIYSRIGKALPKRNNYVLHFDNSLKLEGATLVTNLEEFLMNYKNNDKELFIIGGASVYKQTLPLADRLYITLINKEYEGDVFFPEYDESAFELISSVDNGDLTFEIYERKK